MPFLVHQIRVLSCFPHLLETVLQEVIVSHAPVILNDHDFGSEEQSSEMGCLAWFIRYSNSPCLPTCLDTEFADFH